MTGKEVMRRTMEFQYPGRIAVAKGDYADMAYIEYGRARDFKPSQPGMDEWGCLWTSYKLDQGDQGQVKEHPLADWDRFKDYVFPDPYAEGRFDNVPSQLSQINRDEKFVVGVLGLGAMHLLENVRGFEDHLVDLMLNPERSTALLDGIFRYLEGLTEQFAEHKVDAIFMYDDQATQSGPLFSMDLWREHFKPRYKKLFALAHDRGMKAYMHTCGDIRQHLPELYECGVDMIDNKQPTLWMDSDAVANLRGKVAYSTCIDIQSTIFSVKPEEIEGEVERLIKTLTVPEGGFVGTYYHQDDLGMPKDKVKRMVEAYLKFKW